MLKKILFVFGTRPEAIKMAPVIEIAKQTKGKLNPIVCVTAQHRYLLDQVLTEFNIKPDIDLDLMRPNQTLYDITSQVSRKMKDIYRKIHPDIVFVQGDTSTVFAASLACYYENVNVGHIEAGLRSRNNRNPFPEEINRRFVSLIAEYNFCPTFIAKRNLLSEGVDPKKIFVTGNTIIDALKETLQMVRSKPPAIHRAILKFLQRPFIIITGHRRENFDQGMKNLSMAIKSLAIKYSHFHWLWIVHLNPNARNIVFEKLNNLANVRLVEPLPYGQFVYLMDHCKFIISDSGGIQEEARELQKTVLVTRICTERPEVIKSGTSVLVGTDPVKIKRHVAELLKRRKSNKNMENPFGDGMAAKRIIDVIVKGNCEEFQ